MKHLVNVSGVLFPQSGPHLSLDNRAFRYGYSLFETMLFRNRSIRLADYHWERLQQGMALLEMSVRTGFVQELVREIDRTVGENGIYDRTCRVRIQVFAGHGGLYDPEDASCSYCIEVYPLDTKAWTAAGLKLGIANAVKHTGPLAHLKSGNALPYALAAKQAAMAGWDDALMLNEHGRIADSTISNVFWIKGGKVFTPPLSEGGVGGVMRRHMLMMLPSAGFPVSEKPVCPEELLDADQVFLSNAVRGIRWVGAFGRRNFDVSPIREIGEIPDRSL